MKLKAAVAATLIASCIGFGGINRASAFIKFKRAAINSPRTLHNNSIKPEFKEQGGEYYYKYNGKYVKVLDEDIKDLLGCKDCKPVLSAYNEHVYAMLETGKFLLHYNVEIHKKSAVNIGNVKKMDGSENIRFISIVATANGVFFIYDGAKNLYYINKDDVSRGEVQAIPLNDYISGNSVFLPRIELINPRSDVVILRSPSLKCNIYVSLRDKRIKCAK